MKLRITEHDYNLLRRLTSLSFHQGIDFPPETGCILLVARNNHPSYPSLIVSEVLAPLEGEVTEQGHDGLVFSSAFLRRALLTVRRRNLAGFLTVHTHPLSDRHVGFSPYDDANDPRLMANLYELQPDGVFGSVVLGKNSAAGRLWSPQALTPEPLGELLIMGEQLRWLPLNGAPPPPPPEPAAIFDRGLALTGRGALARLSGMRVGVVGASGTGSLVLELLVRAGVGEVVIFEFDFIEEISLNRVLHSRNRDAAGKVAKAGRMAEALDEIGMPTRITVIEGGDIRQEKVAFELRGCDLVFGCVDNRDWPRLVLTEVAYQYLIPYIDLGTEVGAGVQSLDARVSYVAPGRPCLICSGIVSQQRVTLEGMEPDEQARILAMGYSGEIPMGAPAVMDLNMRAASFGMLVLRHLAQPFLDTPLPIHIKEALTNFSIRRVIHRSKPDCHICGVDGRTGVGDARRLTTK
ncbi:MAG TPA: ThiF family adenylyltransferase [Blastocatellia bacterium]|nr:ThiF family adenylyltransferase [Blastocatellia bacterium]